MPLATAPLPVADAEPEDAKVDGEDEEDDEEDVLEGKMLIYDQNAFRKRFISLNLRVAAAQIVQWRGAL